MTDSRPERQRIQRRSDVVRHRLLDSLLGLVLGVLVTGFTSMIYVGSKLAEFRGELTAFRVEVQGLRRDIDRLEKRG